MDMMPVPIQIFLITIAIMILTVSALLVICYTSLLVPKLFNILKKYLD